MTERRADAARKVAERLGLPCNYRTGIVCGWAVVVGTVTGGIPWLGAVQSFMSELYGLIIPAILLAASAAVHLIIANALQVMAHRHGVGDRRYWLWTLAGVFGLVIGWMVMRRSARA